MDIVTFCVTFVDAVNKHLANEQNRAAVKIQARWKGYCIRRGITCRRHNIERTRAAVTIQRMVTDSSVNFFYHLLSPLYVICSIYVMNQSYFYVAVWLSGNVI